MFRDVRNHDQIEYMCDGVARLLNVDLTLVCVSRNTMCSVVHFRDAYHAIQHAFP